MNIINDNISTEYWSDIKFEYLKFKFNTLLVRDQLINNIYYDNIPFSLINNTFFALNDKKYIIVFPKK